jgi:hypothetical protein
MISDIDLVQLCKDKFQIGHDAYEASSTEALAVWDLYHNRQYTTEQLNKLALRGQPAETFNVIKLFSRMAVGYYSTVVNTAIARPTKLTQIANAQLVNDVLDYSFRTNNFITEGDKVKLGGLISGLLICFVDVKRTGEKDQFGRPLYKIELEYIPDSQCVLDPSSTKDDYSDAKFFHRFKWVSEDDVEKLYGKKKLELLDEYHNHLDIDEAEFEYAYNGQFTGKYRIYNNYLVVHTVIELADKSRWSCHWCGEILLYKKEITKKQVKFPYRVEKLHSSTRTEYYGIFREVIESQHAINQALIKFQLLANSQKVFVETDAVENIDDFTDAVNRVNAVIEVRDLAGIKVEEMSREVLDQYTIIDKAFDRIQRVLSINDSFLGQAFASDSGRKVKLQQNATVIALNYLTNRIEEFYRQLGSDMAKLVKQFYTAEQAILITDEVNGDRWAQLNKPVQLFTGQVDPQTQQPIMEYAYEQIMDPETGKPMVEDGQLVIAPIPEEETEIQFTDVEIAIEANAYNDEDEKNQLLMETVLAGPAGQLMSQVNPAGYFKIYGMSIKSMKTKSTPEIAQIFAETAAMLGGDPAQQEEAKMIAQGQGPGSGGGSNNAPLSQSMKLPQNTNEDAW